MSYSPVTFYDITHDDFSHRNHSPTTYTLITFFLKTLLSPLNLIPGGVNVHTLILPVSSRHKQTFCAPSLCPDWYTSPSLHLILYASRTSQQPRGLRRRSTAACLPRSWVRIPPEAWMFVCCECYVLSGRGLCDELITRPEESYRL